jgi:hypothetical protein
MLIRIVTSMIFCNVFIFSILWCCSRSSTRKFSHVLGRDHIKEVLKSFNILVTRFITHYKIIAFKRNWRILFYLIKKSLVDVESLFIYSQNGGNSLRTNNSITSLIFILKFKKFG